jgi:hypothetical protein
MFRCPSDNLTGNVSDGVLAAFSSSGKKMEFYVLPGPNNNDPGWTNYTGVAGCLGPNTGDPKFDIYEGIFWNRNKVTLGQIAVQDGTSNTLMFGEGLGGLPRNRDYAWSWVGVGCMVTYCGLTLDPPADNPRTSAFRFGSQHARGVNFTFGDCSTRLIRRGNTAQIPRNPFGPNDKSDWHILQALAGRKDGDNIDTSPIVE